MPRTPRVNVKNYYYHVLNRASARLVLFNSHENFKLFEDTLENAKEKYLVDIVSYCCMPNHFHFLIKPNKDGELSRFMYWFTMTLTSRWHALQNTTGSGHIFQGRYKSFIIEDDIHLLTVMRYIERNPLRAGIVDQADLWKYSSLYRRYHGSQKQKSLLSDSGIFLPDDYLTFVQKPLTENELTQIRKSVKKNTPYGSYNWQEKMVDKFYLQATIRRKGRPRKLEKGS